MTSWTLRVRSCFVLLAAMAAGGVIGCAAPAPPPVASAPSTAPAADLLRQVEETAFNAGLEEGRREQWWHDHQLALAHDPKPAAAPPAGAAQAAAPATAAPPAASNAAVTPALPAVPSAPAQSAYDPSGPATPVGNASDPF